MYNAVKMFAVEHLGEKSQWFQVKASIHFKNIEPARTCLFDSFISCCIIILNPWGILVDGGFKTLIMQSVSVQLYFLSGISPFKYLLSLLNKRVEKLHL